jgi:hypothetical protein
MKFSGILLAILAVSAGAARAQSVSDSSLFLSVPAPSLQQAVASPLFSSALRGALLASARPAPAPAPEPMPQYVQGVYPLLYWQASIGFTYNRFYEVPGTAVNTDGFNMSMAYFFKEQMAAEGEIDGGFGTMNGTATRSAFAGGGLRVRVAAPRAIELWAHGLAGGAHFGPKTNFGGTGSFGYELGGGADLKAHHEKLAYRVEADVLGTSFFGTYQISPKLAVGIVYKF